MLYMPKMILRAVLCLLLTLSMLLPLSACTTVSGNGYVGKEELDGLGNAPELIKNAQDKTDTYKDIRYVYDFALGLDAPNGDSYRLGTENTLSVTGRGTESCAAHRKNVYTSVSANNSEPIVSEEEFFLRDGNAYVQRFGKRYRSKMTLEGFLDYTEYSQKSVNTEYLSELNFSDATVYRLFGKKTEIVMKGASDYLIEGIVAFTGLNDTKYLYDVTDVALSVLIDENGYLTEKHLTFNVTYYDQSAPTARLTYNGDFSYTVEATEGVEVADRDRSKMYEDAPYLSLFTYVTGKGYDTLLTIGDLDATYEKYIKVSESSTKEYIFSAKAHITSSLKNGVPDYASIDTEYASTETKKHVTKGIFQNADGYSYRQYDHVTDTASPDVNTAEKKYTDQQIASLISNTLRSEQLFEEEISGISVSAADGTSVTFKVSFNNQAAKVYASYLVDAFSTSSQNTADLNGQALDLKKCDVYVKIRISDGCILSQIIDYEADIVGTGNINGYLNVVGLFKLTVNSTENVSLLTHEDYNNTVNGI